MMHAPPDERLPARSSENSKANRIETSERPGGISRICSMEVVKNSEENSENKRCYANTSYDPAQRRGGGSISALRATGDPAKGDPGGEAPRPRPPPPSFTGVILALRVTGTFPLATQRGVESSASDRSPFAVA